MIVIFVSLVFFIPNLTPPDVTERLTQINPTLAREARKVLDTNKSERHIRGGMATREKSGTSGAGWQHGKSICISILRCRTK